MNGGREKIYIAVVMEIYFIGVGTMVFFSAVVGKVNYYLFFLTEIFKFYRGMC